MRRGSHNGNRRLILLAVIGTVAGCHDAQTDHSRVIAGPGLSKPAVSAIEPKSLPEPAARVFSGEILPQVSRLRVEDAGLQLVMREKRVDCDYEQTAGVRWSAVPDGVVSIDATGYARPLHPGTVTLTARTANGTTDASLEVTGAPDGKRRWDFDTDIVPIFTRLGCNTGGCHGRAEGQNGFRLSLFGYFPEADFLAITRESGGRRLDTLDPDASLLLRKGTGRLVHGGGQRLVPGSDEYARVRAWIRDGAPRSTGENSARATSLALEPSSALLAQPGKLQLRAIAHYSDGTTRDVTRLALFRSNNDRLLSIDGNGVAVLSTAGESDVVARFGSLVATSRIASPVNAEWSRDESEHPIQNFIDEHIYKRLSRLRVPLSPRASDATFLRRVSFDLTGQLPEPDEVKRFVSDADPKKRAAKVAELLERRDFEHFWKLKLGDLLQISPGRFGNGAGAYEFWLEDAVKRNRPWNEMVRELLTTVGDPTDRAKSAAANYALDGPDPQTRAELTARRFMGLRLRCAQCHDHPFDIWTQDDYYGMAAIFAKAEAAAGGAAGVMASRMRITVNPSGSVTHLRTKQPAEPRLLGGEPIRVATNVDPRQRFADWLTRPDNPYFAKAMANWVWAQFFGRGLVEPVDDMGSSNPPSHPELLDALAKHFVESGYDLRALIATITESEIYGLSSGVVAGNAHDERLFSHQLARPLTAHQMADALARATQVPNVFSTRLGNRSKAIEVFNPTVASEILDTFGRCSRMEVCSSVGTPQVSLRQALLLVGGDIVDNKVSHLNGYLARLLELGPSAEEIIEFLYMRTLCRPPTAEEKSHWAAELGSAESLREAAEDLFWALLNSREFAFNH